MGRGGKTENRTASYLDSLYNGQWSPKSSQHEMPGDSPPSIVEGARLFPGRTKSRVFRQDREETLPWKEETEGDSIITFGHPAPSHLSASRMLTAKQILPRQRTGKSFFGETEKPWEKNKKLWKMVFRIPTVRMTVSLPHSYRVKAMIWQATPIIPKIPFSFLEPLSEWIMKDLQILEESIYPVGCWGWGEGERERKKKWKSMQKETTKILNL